jgi:mRNA-degrading endonuclease RelE of RelBE toxin-antitoxin system
MKIRFLVAAETDMRDAADRYETLQAGLGDSFLQELSHRLELVESRPRLFGREECSRSRREIRFCRLRRFPYRIVFEIREPEIVVLAVAHARRRPGYWKHRR